MRAPRKGRVKILEVKGRVYAFFLRSPALFIPSISRGWQTSGVHRPLTGDTMSSLDLSHDTQRVPIARTSHDPRHRADIAARQLRRRLLIASTLGGGVVAASAIAIGLPTAGMAMYLVATLPFTFFA